MEFEQIKIVLDMIKLMSTPNISQFVKEKTIKELVCRSVDSQQDFGAKTKEELKLLVNAANSEIEMTAAILTYMSTHNCYN